MRKTCDRDRMTGKKRKMQKIQWLLSELILILLLIAAAGWLWLNGLEQYSGNHTAPVMSGALAEKRTDGFGQQAVTAGGISAALKDVQQNDSYYAGPSGNVRKEPEEIQIVIDPGHGGVDEGCARRGVREKEVNLSIALRVRDRLEKLGYQVILTRDSDESLSLAERIQTAEKAHADIFVSIHQNSSNLYKVNGLEIYYSAQNAEADSQRLAELIHEDILEDTGVNARSIFKWENIRVIRESKMPACLIETGFLTNAAERKRLSDPSYQEQMAEGIVSGIDRYFRPKTMFLTLGAGEADGVLESAWKVLKQQNIKATFFLSDEILKQKPETARRIVEEGHAIGIYCNWQSYQALYTDVDAYLADIKASYETIVKVTGSAPSLFRTAEDEQESGSEAVSEDILGELEAKGIIPYDWKCLSF